jgi:hypothetical protein
MDLSGTMVELVEWMFLGIDMVGMEYVLSLTWRLADDKQLKGGKRE